MVEGTSYMFITGPDVVQAVTHEQVTKEALGGARRTPEERRLSLHRAGRQRCSSARASCSASCRPTTAKNAPRVRHHRSGDARAPALEAWCRPKATNRTTCATCCGRSSTTATSSSVSPRFAENLLTGFARIDGRSVGIVANQPSVLAGVLDIDASIKGARFVRFCDCFNIPLVTFVDVPGFLPGVDQEHGGIIRHGAKLLYAYCEATVPKLTVITRKAYGGAYDVMNSKHIRADVNLAFPTPRSR